MQSLGKLSRTSLQVVLSFMFLLVPRVSFIIDPKVVVVIRAPTSNSFTLNAVESELFHTTVTGNDSGKRPLAPKKAP